MLFFSLNALSDEVLCVEVVVHCSRGGFVRGASTFCDVVYTNGNGKNPRL